MKNYVKDEHHETSFAANLKMISMKQKIVVDLKSTGLDTGNNCNFN
jgi:hypothetical protein